MQGNPDSALRAINEPVEKVNYLISFLEKDENQFNKRSEDLAKLALNISRQNNYVLGEIRSKLFLGSVLYRRGQYKLAMEYAENSLDQARQNDFIEEVANAHNLIGTIYNQLGDHDNSSPHFFESLKIFERTKNNYGISRSIGNIGKDFFHQGNSSKALQYFNQALEIARSIHSVTLEKQQYNNIAVVYGDSGKYDTAILMLEKAKEINIKVGDSFGQAINLMNIGYDQMNSMKYHEALDNLLHSLQIFKQLDNRIHMAECYMNLGYCYELLLQPDKSRWYFNAALEEGIRGNFFKIINFASAKLNQLSAKSGDTISAYRFLSLEKMSGDSIFSAQKQMLLSKLEMQYLFEKKELKAKIEQRNRNILIGVFIGGLILGLLILFLLFSKHRLKAKLAILDKERVEYELTLKKQELTINLIALIKKNELLADLSRKLISMEKNIRNTDAKDVIAEISSELRQKTEDKMLNEFSTRFQDIHAGFYEKLLAMYPDLTPNELKLCAYLRLNMSTKDISELTGQRVASIDHARYRLRKKLKISNSETNLVAFLTQV